MGLITIDEVCGGDLGMKGKFTRIKLIDGTVGFEDPGHIQDSEESVRDLVPVNAFFDFCGIQLL